MNLRLTYYVVELVIPMDNRVPVARQVFANVLHDLVIFGVSSTKQSSRLDVLYFRLVCFYSGEGITVSCVESSLFAISVQANRVRVDAVKPSQRPKQ